MYLIENTNTTIEMTKKQTLESFTGILNQLEGYEKRELFEQIIPMLSRKDINKLLNYCCERFPSQTSLSLVENGIIEED
jgi:hypothetical protein